ncbi:ribbon-helix-helix protein, CopG family [Mycolicibacterium smegmatis]|uniref:ribbon-helix-helix protein, CopG family n=1 Tax=Mycolicibacterium smegmatis TaxID=1772 RepID=UPI0005D82897|nr:ribbon-helix-helix protein, CopG family [Mycolicibacterium smegmatis]MDF1900771.1 ribbon-helix-helix protein, CopG family [Mycolicibacterium smegmatis]MDF1907050.1 ribbon-helix-helix protein, CopG family [Mycolicibacterium smegmatis]MDF1919245.1 ribbon-helix-helix protein, CopG family [Mycolicibacterium smegmatis]MDF1925312.1 ribbon-helix-helix protein, CopG family [Mycolicibacterium smegmatis]UAK52900.1 ribbon-helix-helix protein, CopG family [Mycolicibacterium smegmatis]
MRTTIAIADELLAAAKRRARQRGQSLGSVIEDALRRELAADQEAAPRPEVPVFTDGTGPRAGIDLRSARALHEVLDEGLDLNALK